MNAEPQIAAYCATVRQGNGPARHRMADKKSRGSDRAPEREQAGRSLGFRPPAGGCAPVADPWPRRPRFSRASRQPLEAATALAAKPAATVVAAFVLLAGLMRVAAEFGSQSGPVIVHLVWPV